MSYHIVAEGFDVIDDYLKIAPQAATEAMRMALNDVGQGLAVRRSREEMEDEVNFPSGYTKSRVGVIRRAINSRLEVVIRGRDRPTSLARFVTGGARSGLRGNIHVRVAKGGTGRVFRKGFVVDLKGRTGDGSNLGLAIRLKPGETMRNSAGAKIFKTDKYGSIALLYGPSVDQIFGEVADQITPDVEEAITAEFFRQFEMLTNA